ncbi:unnamed protein product [Cladocopium goreaui]|uniref:DUF7869 domain-containing protein n=1 Tax=Cladocopium goreaui TaxID=2562237 RepID=A0A9P1FZ13_9DINO|nr:unnamed protein product [Cladocopium goreaui]
MATLPSINALSDDESQNCVAAPGPKPKFRGGRTSLRRPGRGRIIRAAGGGCGPNNSMKNLSNLIRGKCGCKADCFSQFRHQLVLDEWLKQRKLMAKMEKLEKDDHVFKLLQAQAEESCRGSRHIRFLGKPVCNKGFMKLVGIGKYRFNTLSLAARNGEQFCPYDGPELSFLSSGHSHEDIDALFSLLRAHLERNPELWTPEAFKTCLEGFFACPQNRPNEPTRCVEMLSRYKDWTNWLSYHFEHAKLKGIGGPGAPHCIRLERIGSTGVKRESLDTRFWDKREYSPSPSDVIMRTKQWMSDDTWQPTIFLFLPASVAKRAQGKDPFDMDEAARCLEDLSYGFVGTTLLDTSWHGFTNNFF